MLLCPGVDLGKMYDESSSLAGHPRFDTMTRITAWYVGEHPIDDPLLSPLMADPTGLPPLLIQAATGDPIAPDARELADRAEQHGVPVELELYPVDTHIFQLFWSFLPEAQEAMTKIGEFTSRLLDAGEERAGHRGS